MPIASRNATALAIPSEKNGSERASWSAAWRSGPFGDISALSRRARAGAARILSCLAARVALVSQSKPSAITGFGAPSYRSANACAPAASRQRRCALDAPFIRNRPDHGAATTIRKTRSATIIATVWPAVATAAHAIPAAVAAAALATAIAVQVAIAHRPAAKALHSLTFTHRSQRSPMPGAHS